MELLLWSLRAQKYWKLYDDMLSYLVEEVLSLSKGPRDEMLESLLQNFYHSTLLRYEDRFSEIWCGYVNVDFMPQCMHFISHQFLKTGGPIKVLGAEMCPMPDLAVYLCHTWYTKMNPYEQTPYALLIYIESENGVPNFDDDQQEFLKVAHQFIRSKISGRKKELISNPKLFSEAVMASRTLFLINGDIIPSTQTQSVEHVCKGPKHHILNFPRRESEVGNQEKLVVKKAKIVTLSV